MRTFQPCCRNVIFFAPTYGFYPRIVKVSYQYKLLSCFFGEHFTWDLGNWVFLSSNIFLMQSHGLVVGLWPWPTVTAIFVMLNSSVCLAWIEGGSQGAQLTRLRRLSGLAPSTPWKAANNGFPFFQKLPEVKQAPAQARTVEKLQILQLIVESMTFLVYSSIPKVILTILHGRDSQERYKVAFGAP